MRSTPRPSWTALPGLQPDSDPAVVHPALGAHGEGWWSSPKAESGSIKIAKVRMHGEGLMFTAAVGIPQGEG